MRLPKILVVDDVPSNLFAMRRILKKLDIEVVEALSGNEALELVDSNEFFLILLDVQMPGMDGFETASQIFSQSLSYDVPIIFVTGVGREKKYMFKGYETGAVDYLFKPLDPEIVTSKVRVFLKLYLQQQKLIRTQEDLERSNTELDAFAYAASHDLRSPLRGISNLASFLKEDAGDLLPDNCQEHIHEIRKRIDYMNKLMDTLLQYASIGHGDIETEWVSMSDCVDRALTVLDVEIQDRQASVTCDTFPDVKVNSTWISQLYQNLISNSIKFVDSVDPVIHLTAEEGDGVWKFGVHDNGIGIEPKNQEKIFEPFRFLNHKKLYEGSGIGLSTCMKIISRHRGKLWVESAGLKQGSSFYFSLPEVRASVVEGGENSPA